MTGKMTRATPRSRASLTPEHLARLSVIARADHEYFTRDDGRPEYRDRRLLVVLTQGAALHWIDGLTGVKDLDVWTFYAAIPGRRFPADQRETHADLGHSELGRQAYDLSAALPPSVLARWRRWSTFEGRRVDLLMRALPAAPGATEDEAVEALRAWLRQGAASRAAKKPSPWWLAQKAGVGIDPPTLRGRVLWPCQDEVACGGTSPEEGR